MNLRNFFANLFRTKEETKEELMKKFLVVGLGNIGDKYTNTRHISVLKFLMKLQKKIRQPLKLKS